MSRKDKKGPGGGEWIEELEVGRLEGMPGQGVEVGWRMEVGWGWRRAGGGELEELAWGGGGLEHSLSRDKKVNAGAGGKDGEPGPEVFRGPAAGNGRLCSLGQWGWDACRPTMWAAESTVCESSTRMSGYHSGEQGGYVGTGGKGKAYLTVSCWAARWSHGGGWVRFTG